MAEQNHAKEQDDQRRTPADPIELPFDLPEAQITITENVDQRGDRVAHIERVPLAAGGKGCHAEHIIRHR